jgi:DNA-binding CsgD family transcriptional regulator
VAGHARDSVPGGGLLGYLTDVLGAVPGRAAAFYTPDLALGTPGGFWQSTGVPEEALRDYMEHFRDRDVWARAASRTGTPPTGALFDTDRLVEPGELRRTAFHGDYLQPYDIARCLVGVVDDGLGNLLPRIRLTVIRGPSEPAFSADEAGRLALLTRTARSYVTLARTHESVSQAVMLHQATVDLLRMPILLVDGERRIEFVNRSARELLASSGPILRRDGRLRARDPEADRQLGEALRRIAAEPGDVRVVRLGAGRPGVRAPALVVTAVAGQGGDGPAGMMIRVLEPEPVAADRERVLRLLLDLTPPEAQVAVGLAEGLSHEEIARRRGVKVTTVRTTLRRLQEKLGIRRSGQLARFVLELTATGGLRL